MTQSISKFRWKIHTSSILWWKAGTQVLACDSLRVSIDTQLVKSVIAHGHFFVIYVMKLFDLGCPWGLQWNYDWSKIDLVLYSWWESYARVSWSMLWLTSYDLHEIDFINFTWWDCVTKFLLDRTIMTTTWSNRFNHSRDSHLPPSESDHVPLLLEISFALIPLHRESSV